MGFKRERQSVIFYLVSDMSLEAALNREIEFYQSTRTHPSWGYWQAFKGLLMLTPMGWIVDPALKPVFDRVWDRRSEWFIQEAECLK
jgi:hypothetical protein